MSTSTRISILPFSPSTLPAETIPGIEVSIVLPTYNERENLPVLVHQLQSIMAGVSFEIIVVDDDSEDGTWQVAEKLRVLYPNISLIRRIGRKGLSTAITEGFLLGRGRYLVVLDADLQHDARLIRDMLEEIPKCDMVIGSRYTEQTGVPGWNSWRLKLSRAGTVLAQKALRQKVSDPMSGFFMIHRKLIHEVADQLFRSGYKILFDILQKRPDLKIRELQYDFKPRVHGASKLTAAVMLDFLDLLISRAFPARMNVQIVRYGFNAVTSLAACFIALYGLHVLLGQNYPLALAIATESALLSSYIVKNGWKAGPHGLPSPAWRKGLLRYHLACLLGSVLTVAVGWYLVDRGISWLPASILGIWVGMSCNQVTSRFLKNER
ncbi:MAG: glycosyltransferase family 2 protein [Desulfobacteraceae bacterium]|nr:glycosyltransferase family 2 protein [Desulfobacteraceae bacterium]